MDTVTIIGATLDLQEKVVRQAMTPIQDVFMLSIDSQLDYELLKQICLTGHSRVPVYEEVEVPLPADDNSFLTEPARGRPRTQRVKKIIGILLVKHCVLLDPKGKHKADSNKSFKEYRCHSSEKAPTEPSSVCASKRTAFRHIG